MRSFHYRPGKNAFLALGLGAAAALFAWQWWNDGGWIFLAAMLLFGAGAAKATQNALSSEPALRLGKDGLTVRTTFGSTTVAWRDVQRITLETITYRYYGFIPMGRVEMLCVAVNGGVTGTRRLRIAASTIDLPAGGAAGLAMLVQAAHLDAVGEAGVAMAGAGERGWGADLSRSADEPTGPGFDADAAIARYLASKQERAREPSASAASARPTTMPVRPTFGRRTA